MKPISEYNFRDIVGKFVMISGVVINPDFTEYLAYCYIDEEKGLSFKILGMYSAEDSKVVVDEIIILRYNNDIQLELFSATNETLLNEAKRVDDIYTSEDLKKIRNIERYDPYRDNVFPDDLLLLSFITQDDEIKSEPIWIHTNRILDDNVYGVTIEDGKYFSKDTEVAIINKELLFGNAQVNIPDVIALDFSTVDKLHKEVTNDIQET